MREGRRLNKFLVLITFNRAAGNAGQPKKAVYFKEGGIIMFKGMPKAFWIGCAITYGWALGFMMLEWTIPNFPLYKFLGVPACWVYNCLIATYISPICVAWYFAYSEELREQKLAEQKKG
jgi:hypothetical protein